MTDDSLIGSLLEIGFQRRSIHDVIAIPMMNTLPRTGPAHG
jgi:hypothetical protein